MGNVRKKVPLATKLRGGGGLKALVAGPLRTELFCGFLKESHKLFPHRELEYVSDVSTKYFLQILSGAQAVMKLRPDYIHVKATSSLN